MELIQKASRGEKSAEESAHALFNELNKEDLSPDYLSAQLSRITSRLDQQIQRHGLNNDNIADALSEETGLPTEVVKEKILPLINQAQSTTDKALSPEERTVVAATATLMRQFAMSLEQGFGLGVEADPSLTADQLKGPRECGPRACYALAVKNGISPTGDPAQQSQQDLIETLRAECNTSIVGTMPSGITAALEAVTANTNHTVRYSTFEDSKSQIEYLKENTPALVKLGVSLTSQHYTTITDFITHDDRSYARTADGLLIPEKMLSQLLEQKPYPNCCWTISPNIERFADLKLPKP